MDESLFREVTQSIKAVFDLTARVDERVKMLIEKQNQIDTKIEGLSIHHTDLVTKVGILESRNEKEFKEQIARFEDSVKEAENTLKEIDQRLYHVEKSSHTSENRWKSVYTFIRDTAWVLLVCYLLYKLNLNLPPIP